MHGMLSDAYPKATSTRVILLVGRGTAHSHILRYGRAICLPVLCERKAFGRLFNFFISLYYHLLFLFRFRFHNTYLFVRNDPIYLLASLVARPFATGLVFQSSHPHELSHPRWTHRIFTRFTYLLSLPFVDSALVVSPRAVDRMCNYMRSSNIYVIPLLDDGVTHIHNKTSFSSKSDPLKILYIGTHSPKRKLEVVYRACLLAHYRGIPVQMLSVGATPDQHQSLTALPDVSHAIKEGILTILEKIPRCELHRHLNWASVGVSLTPSSRINAEMSPTKLAEYFASHLPVIASNGIALQEEWIKESNAGILVEFSDQSICDGFIYLWENLDKLPLLSRNARHFSEKHLRYDLYIPVLQKALGSGNLHGTPVNKAA